MPRSRPSPLTPEAFRRETGVSRETLARLEAYAALLARWQRRINLASAASLGDVWRRHFLDSAQLFPYLPASLGRLVDLGSGAGFPGLVLAILGADGVELIESDGRKCTFLAEAARVTETAVTIRNARIEWLPWAPADVVTARALAPLQQLLASAERFLTCHSVCLFLKGAGVEEELTSAAKEWNMRVNRQPSKTDPRGVVLHIQGITRELRC
ncbi:MAG: 16S rRNA (guanine(527)-N(7))-methyltransferase RsmG [Alphaproteobacteria bacterium]